MLTTPINSLAIRYGLAVVAVVLAVLVGHVELFEHMRFGLFFFTVAVIAWCSGVGPGLLATALSVLSLAFFFVHPTHSLWITDPFDLLRLGIFILGGLVVNALARENWSSQTENQSLWADLNAARENALRTRVALETLADGLKGPAALLLDPKGCVASWHAAAEQLTGYSAGQILGRHWDVLSPAEAPSSGTPAGRQETPGGGFESDRWLVRADGSRLRGRVAVTPLRNASGLNVGGFLVVLRALDDAAQAVPPAHRV